MGISKTNKTYANRYKTDVSVSQTTNTGFDSTTRVLCSGDGADSAISLSDDVLSVQPVNDDTTGTMLVKNNAGNNILAVDTTNSKVLGGASQTALNTQYAHFGIDATGSTGFIADTHMAVPFGLSEASLSYLTMGSSTSSSFNDTDPATSLTTTTDAMYVVNMFWHVMDNITVDAVKWWSAADTATGDDVAAHLMAYTVDTGNGSTSGDLSSGVVVADGATITNAGHEQLYYQSMTIQSADVDAGKIIMFTFASDTINSDYGINATVKYHIR
tara:strand:+ start:43 stop:858 length:816 start_codon:yes stop_codon:yes gene_type:complete